MTKKIPKNNNNNNTDTDNDKRKQKVSTTERLKSKRRFYLQNKHTSNQPINKSLNINK